MRVTVNLSSGSIDFGIAQIAKGDTLDRISGCGLATVRTIETTTDWKHCGYGKHAVCGEELFIGMSFQSGLLMRVSAECPEDTDGLRKFEFHKAVLACRLPDRRSVARVGSLAYDFDWGVISAAYDPRTDRSTILLSWT